MLVTNETERRVRWALIRTKARQNNSPRLAMSLCGGVTAEWSVTPTGTQITLHNGQPRWVL